MSTETEAALLNAVPIDALEFCMTALSPGSALVVAQARLAVPFVTPVDVLKAVVYRKGAFSP
jgi:hypothetical protein